MKVLSVLLFVALAAAEIDWDNVKPVTEMAGFWDGRSPELRRSYLSMKSKSGRIVNGDIAAPHQFPYQVKDYYFMNFQLTIINLFKVALFSVMSSGTGLCGGSVISSTAILTAAHCSTDGISFNIIFGAVNMRNVEPNQQRRNVPGSGWIQHPDYNRFNLANDVAVIRFPGEPLALNQFVATIELAQDDTELFVDEVVHVSGFGRYSDASPNASDVLRFTVKTVITNLACRIRFPTLVIASTICAIGDEAINNAVCNGDSGGRNSRRNF